MCTDFLPYKFVGENQIHMIGGKQIHIIELSEMLVKHGHEVFYITNKGYGAERRANASFFRATPLPPLLDEFKPLAKMVSNGLLLEKFVKKHKIDLLHIHYSAISLIRFVKMHKVPVVLTMHGGAYPAELTRKSISAVFPAELTRKSISRALYILDFSWLVKNADVVISPSRYLGDFLYNSFGVKCRVIPNAVHIKKIANLPTKHEAKKTFNLHKAVITFMGRLAPEKGLKYLFEAFSILRSKVKAAKLIIAGMGPNERYLKVLSSQLGLEQDVKFLGYVSGHLKSSLLAATDVFVCPSIYEFLPIVNLEALAAGLPIVASRVGGIPDVVEDGVNGFLVPPRDPQALAETILKLLKDEKLRRQIRVNNIQKAKNYDWNVIFPKIYQAYREAFSAG